MMNLDLDLLTAVGSVATPVLLLFLTGVGWRLRAHLERQFALEDKLREDRLGTYDKILEPFILLLTSEAVWRRDPKNKEVDKNAIAINKILSVEYRALSFRLSLVGSDPVVRAYNNVMQYYFECGAQGPGDPKKMMSLLAQLLLEIRRSMGNERTKLDHWDMLEWFIKDVRQHREPQSWWKVLGSWGCRR